MRATYTLLHVLIWAVACQDRSSTVGVFYPTDASPDVVRCQTAKNLTLKALLPVNSATLYEGLPDSFDLGGVVARRDFANSMDALPGQWSIGTTTYESSLSEAGPEGVRFGGGWAELLVHPKVNATDGTTDRKFWGGEIASEATFGHGLFLARVRTDGWGWVQSAFFFANDRFSATGANLGWTGAILEFSHNATLKLNSLFHDSSLGRHDREAVLEPVTGVVLLGLLSLPGRVAFYVNGNLVNEWRDVDELSPWGFHFTHWINNPAPQPFVASNSAVVYGIDFVAHYTAETCP